MDIAVATEARFYRGPDGAIRSLSEGRAYAFWRRYLTAFSSVKVVARVAQANSVSGHIVEGPQVVVHPLPDFTGLIGLMRRRGAVRDALRAITKEHSTAAHIARMPGWVANTMGAMLEGAKKPYGIELVGDPFEASKNLRLFTPFSLAVAHLSKAQIRRRCRRAGAVAYVTRRSLQESYPAGPGAVEATYSSVELPPEAYRRREDYEINGEPRFIIVGTLSQPYKGHDALFLAVADLARRGHTTRLRVVGSGRLEGRLRQRAERLGIARQVDFTGQLSSPGDVRRALDDADIFVLPSLTEGLPRALIEAMARGLPCVATRVGGIPELLHADDLVPVNDPASLADRLEAMLRDPGRRRAAGERNLDEARLYGSEILERERGRFYEGVRAMVAPATLTHEHQARRPQ